MRKYGTSTLFRLDDYDRFLTSCDGKVSFRVVFLIIKTFIVIAMMHGMLVYLLYYTGTTLYMYTVAIPYIIYIRVEACTYDSTDV